MIGDDEARLIEIMNEIDPDWRERFPDAYIAADFYDIGTDESYAELGFEDD